jgi:hypothetical protein
MPDLPKTLLKLSAAVIEHQAKKNLGEEATSLLVNVLAEYAGEKTLDKLVEFVQQGDRAQKLIEAFKEADKCFAKQCGDEMLKQAIAMTPLAEIPSLEKLAAALPETLDDDGLLAALRGRFADDWRNALSDAQLDRAALVYRKCLDRPLAAKCDQLLETLFRKVERIEETTSETLAVARSIEKKIDFLQIGASELNQLGPRDWVRPTAPRPSATLVGRKDEMNSVRKLLAPGAKAAITATVQGTPGVGKTLLAEHLAVELDSGFAGGVLFERLGVGFRDPAQAGLILNQWAAYAFGGGQVKEGAQFTPEAVRALLAGHGSLLVVLDDVWSLEAIRPLQAALPNDACLLVTTRNERLARSLGEVYPLDVLSKDDALKLLRTRVHQAGEADDDLLKRLAEALGRHAMALDIAGRGLARRKRAEWPKRVDDVIWQVREGGGFGELPPLPGDEVKVNAVEAALFTSYSDLDEAARTRFRSLGAFAPDAAFNGLAAAGVWDCSPEEAGGQLTVFVERGLLSRIESPPSPAGPSTAAGTTPASAQGGPTGEGAGGEGRWQQHGLLRAYALALLRRGDEEAEARERQARTYLNLMHALDEAQQFYRLLPDYTQLKHAFEWAIANSLSLAQALSNRTANLQIAFNLVRDHYNWASRVAERAKDSDSMEMKGAALVTLGNALSRLATLPNEDRPARLYESLAAYDEALKHYRADTAPLDYAMTQNNRANVLMNIATLAGEDRGGRLKESLAAYEAALEYRRPETAPLDYATTQNNRALVLSAIATLAGEDRGGRLKDALAAYEAALEYRRPETAPLDYATTQNNRALVLSDIATLAGEDRGGRLKESLAAYEAALEYRRPETAPLDYAQTQNNRALVLSDIATLAGEDRGGRLKESLAAYEAALEYRRPETAPLAYAMTQGNLANLFRAFAALPEEDRRAHLLNALRCAYTALSLFERVGHAPYAQQAARQLRQLGEEAGELFPELWAELKVGEPPEWLAEVLAQSRAFAALPEDLRRALGTFVEARQRAEEEKSAEAWQATALAGQALFDHPEASQLQFEAEQLRAEVASCWNQLGYILSDEQKKPAEALAAFGEAIKLQPDKAMWHRNYTGALIDLGDLAAAEAGLARATELEPEHPRLAELRREMEERRAGVAGSSQ